MKVILWGLLFSLFCSCSIYKPIEFKEFKDYSFSLEEGCNPICLKLGFYNPNFYNVGIRSAKIKAQINNDELGILKLNNQPILRANQESILDFSINTESAHIQPIFAGVLNYFLGKDLKLSIVGNIKVKVLSLTKDIKIDEVYKLGR